MAPTRVDRQGLPEGATDEDFEAESVRYQIEYFCEDGDSAYSGICN